jgi:hypothetical protein
MEIDTEIQAIPKQLQGISGNVDNGRYFSNHIFSQEWDFCHPDEGGARFLRNVGSYKSHTA